MCRLNNNVCTNSIADLPTTNNFMDCMPVESTYGSDLDKYAGANIYNTLPIDEESVSENNDNDNYDVVGNPVMMHNPIEIINHTIQSHIRRPNNVINRKPQNDTITYNQLPKHIPGNSSYANIATKGKKICIVTDSICSRIKMKVFNRFINNGRAYRKAFSGGTSDEIAYYCIHTLVNNKPDTVIINAGSNDLHNLTSDVIAQNVSNIVNICHKHGVTNVFVSSIIYRKDMSEKVSEINSLLKSNEALYDYVFIDNSNVTPQNIWIDNIHPNNEGLEKIANNFINALNNTC